ncbi:MAG: hypothetical protein WCQ89_19380 [Verrucomicrobiota bacterium]
MARLLHFKPLAAALGTALLTTALPAQNPATPAPPATAESAAPRTAEVESPRRTRAVSNGVAAALAAASPKYTPPVPKPPPPPPKPEEELPDLRDVDKPKNGIVRLPKYVVREPKPVIFSERAISTTKGITDIAMKRYLTETDRVLNRFRIPILTMTNEERALAMYAEDERLKNMSDLKDNATAAGMADSNSGSYLKKEAQKTFLRSSDFGWNGGGPK